MAPNSPVRSHGSPDDDFSVDLNLTPGFMRMFKNMAFEPWYAIGEFVDNSITSALKELAGLRDYHGGTYVLEIDISFDGDTLVIKDNAGGITRDDFQRALRVGEPPPQQELGLSVYGVGMKLAAFWWGKELRIDTWPLGEPHGWHFDVNVDELTEEAASGRRQVRKVSPRGPGTIITIGKLQQRRPQTKTVGTIRDYLASIYRLFLDDEGDLKVVIRYEGTPLEYQRPALLTAPYWDSNQGPAEGAQPITWRKNVKIDVGDGKTVTGWVGILERTSRAQSGLLLHFRRKGVQGAVPLGEGGASTQVSAYKPALVFGQEGSPRNISLVGEIDVSALGKTVTTDKVLWDIDAEDRFVSGLAAQLRDPDMNLLTMADNYRRRRNQRDPRTVEDESKKIQELGEEIRSRLAGVDHADASAPVPSETVTEEGPPLVFSIPDQQGHLHRFHIVFLADRSQPLLDLLTIEAEHEHVVRINEAHPALARVAPIEERVRQTVLTLLLHLAAAEAFSTSPTSSMLRAKFNQLLDRFRGGR